MPTATNNGRNCTNNSNDRKGTTETNALTLEKYLMHLRQKEERIRQLEEENRTLKSELLDRSRACQAQVDELTGELVRNAEMVARLQSNLELNKGASIITHSVPSLRDLSQPKEARKVTSSTINRYQQQQQQQPLLPGHQFQLNGSHSSARPPAKVPTNVALPPHAVKCVGTAAYQPQASTSATDVDEICAALQNFVERNRTNPPQQQNRAGVVEAIMGVLKGGQGEGTAQPTQPQPSVAGEEELAAQIAKFVADNPSCLFSGLLFVSDPSQQRQPPLDQSSVPSPAAATVAESGEVKITPPRPSTASLDFSRFEFEKVIGRPVEPFTHSSDSEAE